MHLLPNVNVLPIPRLCLPIAMFLLSVVCQHGVQAGEVIQTLGILPDQSQFYVQMDPWGGSTFAFRDGRLFIDDEANGIACEPQTLAGHQGWSSQQSRGQDLVRSLFWYVQGDALLGWYDDEKPITGFGGTDPYVECLYGWRVGAPTPAACLDQALAAIAARRPQEAIPMLQAVIEFDRNELPLSLPAVQALVQAFQMIKDQPGMEQRYHEVVGRYLSTVPLLDGAARPDPAAAEEDLLWKSWYQNRPSRFEADLLGVNGVILPSGKLQVSISFNGDSRMRLIHNPHVLQVATDGMLGDTHADRLADQNQPYPYQLLVSNNYSAHVYLSFPVTFARGSVLPPLSFRLHASQASRSSVHRVLIKPGVAWKNNGGTGSVESLTQIGDTWKLVTKEEGVELLKMKTFDAEGREIQTPRPSGGRGQRDTSVQYLVRDFPVQPVRLELTTVDRVSTREIPFTVTGLTVE